MGLRGFGPWLRAHFPTAFTRLNDHQPAPYTAVHIDINTLLYTFARQTDSPARVLHSASAYLHSLLSERTRPLDRLVLAVDGAASVPKLAVQRLRRRQNGERADRDGLFDCRQFTPGCLFMAEFAGRAREWSVNWFRSRLLPDRCTVVIDPVTRAGEGEHKILQDIYRHSQPGDRIAIVSTDSDLFLYPLLAPADRQIDIHIPFADGDMFSVLSINKLRELMMEATNSPNISDLIILAMLSGNDYVPSVPWASLRTTYPNYLTHLHSHRYTGPFYNLSKQRFYANNLRTFLKHHHKSMAPSNYRPSEGACARDYLSVLSWTVQQMTGGGGDGLVDMRTPRSVSLESLLEADYSKPPVVPEIDKFPYIPGAIGLALLSPDNGGRQHLPACLHHIEPPSQAKWWEDSSPGPLLQHYNKLIAHVRGDMTDRERAAVDPGQQIIVTSVQVLLNA